MIITELLVVGGWVFWTALSLITLLMMIEVSCEKPLFAAITLGIFVTLCYKSLKGIVSVKLLMWAVPIYFIIGASWSVWRWLCHVNAYVRENKEDFLRHTPDWIPMKIDASYNKGKITNWIMFWPWSAAWLMTGDILTSIFNSLYGIYHSITTSAVRKVRQS